jgi:hypothetical protein
MNLYKIVYLRKPQSPITKYVIAESQLEAISISQPYYNDIDKMDYSGIEIDLLCPSSGIVKKTETPHVIENEN